MRGVLFGRMLAGTRFQFGISLILNCGGARVCDEAGYDSVEQEQRTIQPHSSISLYRAAVGGVAGAFNGDGAGAGQLQQPAAGSG